jgi:hypothetical protein
MQKWYVGSCLEVVIVIVAILALTTPVQAFDVKFSGQVNQMLMFADNGFNTEFFVADNDNSGTRFRITGNEKFDAVTVGYRIEFGAQRNASGTLDIGGNDDGIFQFNDRWLEAYFQMGWGKLSIGKGDGASNGTSEVDLSGTAVITYAAVNDTAGSFTWTFKDGSKLLRPDLADPTGPSTATDVKDTRSSFDGLSRNERIRYDTPKFAGFGFATSITNGKAWEIAGRYAGALSDHKLAAAVGYVDTNDRTTPGQTDYRQLGSSVSWLTPLGLNLTASYGYRKYFGQFKQTRLAVGGTSDSQNYYLKVGWKGGIHAASVEAGRTDDLYLKGDKSTNIGAAYVITPWGGVEFYGAIRSYKLDQIGPDPENISQIMAGTRIKF